MMNYVNMGGCSSRCVFPSRAENPALVGEQARGVRFDRIIACVMNLEAFDRVFNIYDVSSYLNQTEVIYKFLR